MKRGDLVAVIEAAYSVDRDDRGWLSAMHEVLAPTVDRGLGTLAFRYDASSGRLRVLDMVGHAPAIELSTMRGIFESLPGAYVENSFRSLPCGTASEIPGFEGEPSVPAVLRPAGVEDLIAINAYDPSGGGICFEAFMRERTRLTTKQRCALSRVAAHVVAGFRLRERAVCDEAVLRPDGRVLHAEGEAREGAARNALAAAVREIERARGPLRRKDPEAAVARWRALVSARWSLVDQFERDGMRYLVAKTNDPQPRDWLELAPRERQVVACAALGHHNKLIAYELGLAHSTVRVLIQRAMSKVGVKTRDELIARYRSDTERRTTRARKPSSDHS